MYRPTKKQIDYLRIALGMTGLVAISNDTAELILVVQSEMKRLGAKYSLKDAAKVVEEMNARILKRMNSGKISPAPAKK